MNEQKVYLGGGLTNNWHEKVEKVDGYIYFNPRTKELPDSNRGSMTFAMYSTWDLHYVRQSDIVFIYVEKDNPSCIGLSVEAGYAKGLGKTVILVLEPNHYRISDNSLAFISCVADITFETLDEGVEFLKSLRI